MNLVDTCKLCQVGPIKRRYTDRPRSHESHQSASQDLDICAKDRTHEYNLLGFRFIPTLLTLTKNLSCCALGGTSNLNINLDKPQCLHLFLGREGIIVESKIEFNNSRQEPSFGTPAAGSVCRSHELKICDCLLFCCDFRMATTRGSTYSAQVEAKKFKLTGVMSEPKISKESEQSRENHSRRNTTRYERRTTTLVHQVSPQVYSSSTVNDYVEYGSYKSILVDTWID